PRVVFMGTPAFAVPALEAVARRCEGVRGVTRADRPRGRGRGTAASEVAAAAQARGAGGVEAGGPDGRAGGGGVAGGEGGAVRREMAVLEADLFCVVAFGAILAPALLATPRLGCINLHASLLPEYRGASPVQRALWDGRAWTGVTTLWMDEGIDTGDVIRQR